MGIVTRSGKSRASDVWFTEGMLHVKLEDGREVDTPLVWFPKLNRASKDDLDSWELIDQGKGIRWKNLDTDLSIDGLM